MVTATRTTSDASTFAHLLDTVLALSETSPICLCLIQNGYIDLSSFLGIYENELESLEYIPLPIDQEVVPLSARLLMAHWQLLRYFLRWIRQLSHENGGTLSNYELISLATDDFSLHRRSSSVHMPEPPSAPTQRSTSTLTTTTNSSCSAVADFKRGVKQDKTHYPVLKDDRYWDNFYRTFVVTAVSHNVDNVLDPAFC
jgi:hypothetical protein